MDCLLYTSDAADDLLCVDLGGRRIIKKKKRKKEKVPVISYFKNRDKYNRTKADVDGTETTMIIR